MAAIEAPESLWSRPEMERALAARDIAGVFKLIQQYTGAAQARIGAATGLGQSRVNELMNGKRRVTSIEVLERIASGLAMPDRARMALGLTPVGAAIPVQPGRVGIAAAYASQESAAAEIRDAAWQATTIDLLAVRALGLIALNGSLLRDPLSAPREQPVTVRVLLLDPDSPAAAHRAAEIGESAGSFTAGIRMAIARLEELAALDHIDLTARTYTSMPVWRIIRVDHAVYLSMFDPAAEGHESDVYKITGTGNLLHAGFNRHFEDYWTNATPAV